MAVKNLGIAVIEGRWFDQSNLSVKPMFDVLSEVWTGGKSSGYHYEMFNDATALKEIFLRVSNKRGVRIVYAAAHGERHAIKGSNGKPVTRAHLRRMLRQVADEGCRKMKGLFVGSCNFVTEDTAAFILKGSMQREHPMIWLAGYETPVDWLHSMAVDMFFFNTWMRDSGHGGEAARIRRVAKAVGEFMPGAAKKLGFNIYVRRSGDNGVEALLPPYRS